MIHRSDLYIIFSLCIALAIGSGSNYQRASFYTDSWFDSLNVSFVDNWPFARSMAVAYDESRHISALGSGGGVYLLDVADPSNPVKLSEAIHTRGLVEALFYQDSTERLYLACGITGIEIWDISNPSAPVRLSFFDTPDYAYDINVLDSCAYVADRDSGLLIINVSNPMNPYIVGSCNTPGWTMEIFLQYPYAYVADRWEGFRIIDISDPSTPYEIGAGHAGGWCNGLFVVDTTAFIVTFGGNFTVFNVADPSNPFEIGSCYHHLFGEGISVKDTFAYIASTMWPGLCVINIADPTNPQIIGEFDLVGHSFDICVSDTLLYLADFAGLFTVNITNPGNPHLTGEYHVDYLLDNIYVQDQYAFTAGSRNKIRIIDLSSGPWPQEIGNCTVTHAIDIFVRNSYAYVIGSGHFCIIDISQPANPYLVSQLQLDDYGYAIYVQDQHAYAACGISDGALYIIDITDHQFPVIVSVYSNPARDIHVNGDFAYILTNHNYDPVMAVIDISDPANPYEIGWCLIPDDARKIFVSGRYAYIANGDNGIFIIDVSSPNNPIQIGHYPVTDRALGVFVKDEFAYIANHRDGLNIINISDPANPIEVGYYDSPGSASNVFVTDSLIYVADGYCGIQIYKNLLLGIDDAHCNPITTHLKLLVNPVTDNMIRLQINNFDRQNLKLYNSLGQLVKKYEINQNMIGTSIVALPVNDIPEGVYFLKTENPFQERSLKIAIIR